MNADQTIKALNDLLEESQALTRKALAHAQSSFRNGIFIGAGAAAFVALAGKWWYS